MDHWPAPSLIDRLLFENFWPGLLIAAVAGLMLLVYSARMRSRAMLIASAVCLMVGGLFPVASIMVQTDRETLIAHTTRFPAAFVPQLNEPALVALLDENVSFDVGPATGVRLNRDTLLQQARSVDRAFQLTRAAILSADACSTGPDSGESFLHVRTNIRSDQGLLAAAGQPFNTQWRMEWRKTDAGWRVTRVVWFKYMGQEPTTGMLP